MIDIGAPGGLIGVLKENGMSNLDISAVAVALKEPTTSRFIQCLFTTYFSSSEAVRRELHRATSDLSKPAQQLFLAVDQLSAHFGGIFSSSYEEVAQVIECASDDDLVETRRYLWRLSSLAHQPKSQLHRILLENGVDPADAAIWAEAMHATANLVAPTTPDQWLVYFAILMTVVPAMQRLATNVA